MSTDLRQLFDNLADEMTDTDYTDLRARMESTSRRIGRRHTMALAAAGFAAVVAVVGGAYALATPTTPGPGPDIGPAITGGTSPSAAPTTAAPSTPPASPSTTGVPANVVPGTLVYLSVRAGRPITLTTVTDGVARQSTFGTATASDQYVVVPSPDATRLAAVESSDPLTLAPGDLVIISAGGARHTIANGVRWGGGGRPVWMPDGRHIIANVSGQSTLINVTTGKATVAQPAEGNDNYLTWSANGHWRAYGLTTDVKVTAADGSHAVRRSIASRPECQQQPACPTSVHAVSDDGRYVALGTQAGDPTHVDTAYLVLDMKTGKMVDLPPVAPNAKLYRIFFRSDGGMVVQTRTGAKYAFVLLRPDGSTISSFPDTQEQGPAGRQLVAYHP